MQICLRANWILIPLITVGTMLFSQWAMKGQWLWLFRLNLPPILPPAWFFGAAWTTIYILTTLCALIIFNLFEHNLRWYAIILIFAGNVLLNSAWVYLFFTQHNLGHAALWCSMTSLTTRIIIALIKPISVLTVLLLAPYALWITFITMLASWIWFIN